MERTFGNQTVDLERVRQNSIVLLDLDQPLSETIFQHEYQTAIRLIDEIVKRNAKLENDKNNSSGFQTKTKSYGYTDLQTAIPFIGDRGTGKTSMMISVWNWMKRYPGSRQNDQLKLTGDPRFICLDMIDAAKLQGSEDVLEIILSRLLSYLQENNQDRSGKRADYRELYKKIDFLYKDLARTHWSNGSKEEEAGLLQLQAIADSQKTSEQFRELIREFVKTIGGDRTFLVIALDDIDMYQGSGRNVSQTRSESKDESNDKFILLEQIYNYLRAPNLILLLTYNETILRRICMGHFFGLYKDSEITQEDGAVAKMDVEAMTRQYLTKLFPHEQRIYLPDFMRIASMNQVNLYIIPKIDNRTIPPFDKENQKPYLAPAQVSVKEFMLRLIAYRTGVYYDIKGNKKHFFEPRNLRELGSMIQVLEGMKEIPEKGTKEEIEAARAQNRQLLLNYLYNQFSADHLSRDEYFAFSQLCMLPIFRQNREFIDRVSQYMRANGNTKQEERRKAYSYGEMLRNIYDSTRNEISLACYSKEYVHCLLGTHSVILNQTAQIQQSQDEWMKLIGTSIAGSWANNMLPDVINVPENQYGRESEISGAGSMSLPASTFFELRLPSRLYRALFCMAGCKNTGYEPADAEKEVCRFIEAMVLLGMFFTGFPKEGLQLWACFGMTKENVSTLKVTVKSKCFEYLCFNALNFVINSYLSSYPHSSCSVNGENSTYLRYIREQLKNLGESMAAIISNDENFYLLQVKTARYEYNKINEEIARRKTQSYRQIDVLEKHANDEKEKEMALTWILKRYFEVKESEIEEKVKWVTEMDVTYAGQKSFIKRWDKILNEVIGKPRPEGTAAESEKPANQNRARKRKSFLTRSQEWEKQYGSKLFVFPIQQFDMSYNILKRLAHPAYYDREIPTNTGLSEVYDYFVSLYQSIENQLAEQDQTFCLEGEECFAEAYRNSAFYQKFVNLADPKPTRISDRGKQQTGDPYGSYLRILFTEMLEQAIQEKATRESLKTTISGPGTLL